mmetsp:Transcript_50224/g.108830  ORF Transcript_50224/g.108830 Transcript_50224/m.108830 type:complete len:338 (+) Transcript_50224:623-1636(+)
MVPEGRKGNGAARAAAAVRLRSGSGPVWIVVPSGRVGVLRATAVARDVILSAVAEGDVGLMRAVENGVELTHEGVGTDGLVVGEHEERDADPIDLGRLVVNVGRRLLSHLVEDPGAALIKLVLSGRRVETEISWRWRRGVDIVERRLELLVDAVDLHRHREELSGPVGEPRARRAPVLVAHLAAAERDDDADGSSGEERLRLLDGEQRRVVRDDGRVHVHSLVFRPNVRREEGGRRDRRAHPRKERPVRGAVELKRQHPALGRAAVVRVDEGSPRAALVRCGGGHEEVRDAAASGVVFARRRRRLVVADAARAHRVADHRLKVLCRDLSSGGEQAQV